MCKCEWKSCQVLQHISISASRLVFIIQYYLFCDFHKSWWQESHTWFKKAWKRDLLWKSATAILSCKQHLNIWWSARRTVEATRVHLKSNASCETRTVTQGADPQQVNKEIRLCVFLIFLNSYSSSSLSLAFLPHLSSGSQGERAIGLDLPRHRAAHTLAHFPLSSKIRATGMRVLFTKWYGPCWIKARWKHSVLSPNLRWQRSLTCRERNSSQRQK